jgi:hypothetical protein
MLACDASPAPDDFASDKSYFGQLCLASRAVCDQRRFREASLSEQTGWWFNHKKENSS